MSSGVSGRDTGSALSAAMLTVNVEKAGTIDLISDTIYTF